MSTEPRFDKRTEQSIDAALAGALQLLKMIDEKEPISHEVKADNTLVLNVDLALQKVILKSLAGESIVSEEMPETHALIGTDASYFLIDPIDGTTSCKRFFAETGTQVGFGPIVGFVREGRLLGVAFYNAPMRKLFVAEQDKGCWAKEIAFAEGKLVNEGIYERLSPEFPDSLAECGVLFFVGLNGELEAIEKLKRANAAENFHRFGGFANDCSRLAKGFEQVQIQYSAKAWDLPAVLLASEAGLAVHVGRGKVQGEISKWQVASNNPVCIAPPKLLMQALEIIS